MLSFFESLMEYVELAWSVFLNFLNSLLGILSLLASSMTTPTLIAGWVWGPIGTCVIAVWSLSVVKFIFGRSNL